MGRQVGGWWRTAPRVVLHPIIQIRVRTWDPTTFTPLPRSICILQVSFHCCWCHLSPRGPAEDSFKIRWKESARLVLGDLWSAGMCLSCRGFTVLCPRYVAVSKVARWATVDRGVSHLGVIYKHIRASQFSRLTCCRTPVGWAQQPLHQKQSNSKVLTYFKLSLHHVTDLSSTFSYSLCIYWTLITTYSKFILDDFHLSLFCLLPGSLSQWQRSNPRPLSPWPYWYAPKLAERTIISPVCPASACLRVEE